MSRVADEVIATVNHFFGLPSRAHHQEANESKEANTIIPVDIMDSPKELIFFMDVPGLSKSEIQVTVEEEKILVIRSNGKRKREDGEEEEEEEEEEGCKYIRLERRARQKLLRKLRLPENANVSAISAKCENGVLTIVVEKLPPPPKSKSVEIAIS